MWALRPCSVYVRFPSDLYICLCKDIVTTLARRANQIVIQGKWLSSAANIEKDSKCTEKEKDMIHINCTLHEFLMENIGTGIFNMEDIYEMMLWNITCMFCVPITTVLIQITLFFKSERILKFYAFWKKLAHD